MGFAVALYFDPETEARVRKLWRSLSAASLESTVQVAGLRPHISLAGFENLNPARFLPVLHEFAEKEPPLSLRFSAVGSFPTAQGVVFLTPAPSPALLGLHDRFHTRLGRMGINPSPYYMPGAWIPHCTVSLNLPAPLVPRAMQVCLEADVFHAGEGIGLGLIEYPPVREIAVFPLEGSENPGEA